MQACCTRTAVDITEDIIIHTLVNAADSRLSSTSPPPPASAEVGGDLVGGALRFLFRPAATSFTDLNLNRPFFVAGAGICCSAVKSKYSRQITYGATSRFCRQLFR